MALILCLETATEICSVALTENGKVLALQENKEGNKHASVLTTLINEVLSKAKKDLAQLDAVAVSKGPGSYTGLRVGVSSAKGLCYALQIPLIAINTLESLASIFILAKTPQLEFGSNDFFIPMLDARRMEVYCAIFDKNLQTISATEAKIIDEHSFENLMKDTCYLFGNGASKCKTIIRSERAVFVDDIQCSALGMASLAQHKFETKTFEDVAYFEPYYLKDFVGTKPKKT